MIYLDNAASTAVDRQVIEEMIPFFGQQYGNPSSIHRYGRLASKALQRARKRIASLINAEPSEILLTSGGTESNNTALYGMVRTVRGKHVITSSIEHEAVLEPCKRLERMGVRITYLPVDMYGTIDLDNLHSSISEETSLVSIMFANNEVGTIQPVQEISDICHANNVLFHTDAVQAVGKYPIDVKDLGIDLLSISSHKINGPKGVGALYVRRGVKLDPLILGGGQEQGMRSGTENVPGIVGFGKACELSQENLFENTKRSKKLHDKLTSAILANVSLSSLNGHPSKRIPNNVHLTFLGVSGEDLIIKLDEYGVAASTGSACSVHTQKASHVLQAMGLSREQITGSLRLTLGTSNTEEEIDRVIDIIDKAVSELRRFSPYREKYNF